MAHTVPTLRGTRKRMSMHRAILATVFLLPGLACSSPRPAGAGTPGDTDVHDLPLVDMPVRDTAGTRFAVLLTGDGGWAHLDKAVAERLTAAGIPVVGFNSRDYLETRRTPEEVARAVTRVIRHYARAWHRDSVVLVGYSRGADVLPFVVNRLPAGLRHRTVLLALFAPAERAGFQFHWVDLLVNTSSPGDLPVLPQIDSIPGIPALCVYGKDEEESLCRQHLPSNVTVIERAGGHHLGGDYRALGDLVVRALDAEP